MSDYGGNNIGISATGFDYTLVPIPDTVVNSSDFLARYGAFPTNKTWYVTAGTFPQQQWPAPSPSDLDSVRINKHVRVNQRSQGASFATSESTAKLAAPNGNGFSAAIAKTSDGGKTWTSVYQDTTSQIYPNAINCWTESHYIAVLEGGSSRIIVTRDGGKTWNVTQHDPDPHSSLFAVKMLSDTEAWVAGGHPHAPNFEGHLFHTLDGGSTWTKEVKAGAYFVSMDMLSADSGYAVALTNHQPAGVQLWRFGTHAEH